MSNARDKILDYFRGYIALMGEPKASMMASVFCLGLELHKNYPTETEALLKELHNAGMDPSTEGLGVALAAITDS